MPWVVGIDEAGYGPNLGPLVMSSVAYHRDGEAETNMWRLLQRAVRRGSDKPDARFVVDDSKRVYSTTRGLGELERSVHGILFRGVAGTLKELLTRISNASDELSRECWFRGGTALPVETASDELAPAVERLVETLAAAGVTRIVVRCEVVCPQRFNNCLERWDSKAAVLGLGLAELMRFNRRTLDDAEPLAFFVDKHGGRNHYSALVQHAVEDGMVMADAEGARRSAYRVHGLERDMSIVFQPEADASHFCVALASMLCKYIREVLMREFNAFWQEQVPGLKATAGYPGDAQRFYDGIRPTMARLCLAEDVIWRRR